MRMRRTGGFTVAEVCVVLGVVSLLGGFAATIGFKARHTSDLCAAEADIILLENAVQEYYHKRGGPLMDPNRDGITTTDEIVSQLKDWQCLDESFTGRDPWGREYVIVLSRDYMLSPDAKFYSLATPVNNDADGMQVYSRGPDGKTSDSLVNTLSGDDVTNFDDAHQPSS